MKIDYTDNWPRRHLKALRFNYGSAPFYDYLYPEIEQLISSRPTMLGELSTASVLLTHKFLKAKSVIEAAVRKNGDGADGAGPSVSSGVKLQMDPYRQNFPGFEEGLSTLDLLFNYGPAASSMIQECTNLIEPAP